MGTYIDNAFEAAARTVALTGGVARNLLIKRWDVSKIVQELRSSVLAASGIDQFIIADEEFDARRDAHPSRRKPANLTTAQGAFVKAEGQLFRQLAEITVLPSEYRQRLTHSSCPVAAGLVKPTMIRRQHCELPAHTTQAMRHLSSVPLTIDQTMFEEWVIPYRKRLRDYAIPKWDGCGADRTKDQFLFLQYFEECQKIGNDLAWTVADRGDGQGRVYEEGGCNHMFNHLIRNITRHGESVKISKDEQDAKTRYLRLRWKVPNWGAHVRKVLGDSVGYTMASARPGKLIDMEMGDIFGWIHSELTGTCNTFFDFDAVCSVMQHGMCSAGDREGLNAFCNVANPDQMHPKEVLTRHVMASHKGRQVLGHHTLAYAKVLGGMVMSPLGYGASERGVTTAWTDSFWDGDMWRANWAEDKAKTPYVPGPLRDHVAAQLGENWDPGDVIDILEAHAKQWVTSFRACFPSLHLENKNLKEAWENSWDTDGCPPVQHRPGGWEYNPPKWKLDKHAYRDTNEASWVSDTGVECNTTQRKIHDVKENSAKSTAPALVRQSNDAHTCATTINLYFDEVPDASMKTTHDAHRIRWQDRNVIQSIYNRAIGETHNVTIPEGWRLLD